MKRSLSLLLVMLLVLLPEITRAQDAPSSTVGTPVTSPEAVSSPASTVFVRESGTLGRYLATPDGIALYISDNDVTANESTCTDACTAIWTPFDSGEPLTVPANVPGTLERFTRSDGISQLSYNGMPLYTYTADSGAGSVTGVGVGDVWRLAVPGEQLGAPATPVIPTAVDMGTPRAAGSVPVSMREFYIQSAAVTFEPGFAYTFEITNLGTSEHQFVIEPAGAHDQPIDTDDGLAEITTIAPGESATLIVIFTGSGNFQFASHTGDDYEQGMALDIVVV